MELSWLLITLPVLVSFFSSHPLVLCLSLIFLTLALSPLISMVLSKWVAYAVILIFLGGMMVLFIYVSTLAGAEKLILTPSRHLGPLFIVMMLPILIPSEINSFLVSHLYNTCTIPLLLFLTMYLLLTLIVVIFLAQGFKGALMVYI